MPFKKLFHQPELRPDQLNADNQITDRRILSRDRVKFGVGCIMYQSEESGLTPIHTMMVRLLGGGNLHLGVVAGASTVGSLVQWIGAVLLSAGMTLRELPIAAAGVMIGPLALFFLLCRFQTPQLRRK